MSYTAYYGSKRGVLAYYQARTAMLLGAYRSCSTIDFDRVKRLVFVCKGNICRSAFADVYGTTLGLNCFSAGIEARGGDTANARVISLARTRNLEMGEHRTRRLDQQRFSDTDLLIGMEPWHLEPMYKAANGGQVTLLGLWHHPYRPYLHDPYSAPDSYMETCINYIEHAVTTLAHKTTPTNDLTKTS